MSLPGKPWECGRTAIPGLQTGNLPSHGTRSTTGRTVLNSNAPQLSHHQMGSARTVVVPPLPPRPPQLTIAAQPRPSYGIAPSAPSMYGGGYSGYSGYGRYSSYGSYPGNMYMGAHGYGAYGQPANAFENRFLQAAEDSSRNAFQSIESLVQAFTSVSMMLESTYHAMYSSFRAILGVVDNFSRLRQMFAQFLSAITILNMIKTFYRRLLYWLGVMDHNPQSDQIWDAVTTGSSNNQIANYSSWPLFTFICLLFGGPYLISRFCCPNTLEPKMWDYLKGTFYKATYAHEAASEAELSFNENEVLNVAPAEFQLKDGKGWLLAGNQQGKIGYVPITRLSKPLKPTFRLNKDSDSTKPTSDNTSFQSRD